jgi:hypothetical protein
MPHPEPGRPRRPFDTTYAACWATVWLAAAALVLWWPL